MADPVTTGLTLAWPWLLALLPLPLLARRWLKPAASSGASAVRVPWFAMLDDSGSAWMRKPVLATLAALAWLALLLAAARPQWVGEIQTLPVTGRDLLLAVDISGSMTEDDMMIGGRVVEVESLFRRDHQAGLGEGIPEALLMGVLDRVAGGFLHDEHHALALELRQAFAVGTQQQFSSIVFVDLVGLPLIADCKIQIPVMVPVAPS